ncbi:MAG: DUF952 domain-containing protein [Chitinophagaceae bacterium]
MIFHITTPACWEQAITNGLFESASLSRQGFIHCCMENQLNGVIARYYSELDELLILEIDEGKLVVPVKYEPSPVVDELYPHVYGAINLGAIVEVVVRK